ncbi:TolC family protein [bacterium]|nr:TolC family protein [bacterium]MBU1994848.1 TolC family protein [bacterium]
MIKILSIFSLSAIFLAALTLDESVDLAIKNSTKLQEIALNKNIKELHVHQKEALHYGELSLVGSFDKYNLPRTLAPLTPSSISPSIATTDNLFSVGLNYSVALFTGFAQTKNIEIENLQKNSALIIEKLSQEQIIYNVKNIYASLLSLNEQLKSVNNYLKVQSDFASIINQEVELGRKAYIDELKTMSDLESIKANQQTLLANIDILKASLKYFINQDIDELEDISIEISKQEYEAENIDTLERLKVQELNLNIMDKKVDIKKSYLFPQVSLHGYYGQNFGFNDAKNPNEGDFNNQEIWQIGLKVQYSLYDFGAHSSELESTKLEKLQNKIKKDDLKREIQKEITSSFAKLNESIAIYKSTNAKYELLAKTAAIEKIRYDNEVASINDLLFINAQKEMAKAQMIDSKYNYQKAVYYIEYILEKGNL